MHSDEYVKFLEKVNPSNCLEEQWDLDVRRFHCGSEECPIFDGLFSVRPRKQRPESTTQHWLIAFGTVQYCQTYTGASIAGAVKLNHDEADICINWAGARLPAWPFRSKHSLLTLQMRAGCRRDAPYSSYPGIWALLH